MWQGFGSPVWLGLGLWVSLIYPQDQHLCLLLIQRYHSAGGESRCGPRNLLQSAGAGGCTPPQCCPLLSTGKAPGSPGQSGELPRSSLPWSSVTSRWHTAAPSPGLPALVPLPGHSLHRSPHQTCCEPSDIWCPFTDGDRPSEL